jgi:hypothetical protein
MFKTKSKFSFFHVVTFILVMMLAMVVLTSCGGGDDDADDPTDAPAPTEVVTEEASDAGDVGDSSDAGDEVPAGDLPLARVHRAFAVAGLVVYSGPSASSTVLGRYHEETFIITGRTEDDRFYRMEFEGETGWLRNDYTTIEGDLEAAPVIAAAE